MYAGILGIHQRSPLGVVLVVSLVAVLAAGTLMAVGLTELLGLEAEGVSGALPFLQSVF